MIQITKYNAVQWMEYSTFTGYSIKLDDWHLIGEHVIEGTITKDKIEKMLANKTLIKRINSIERNIPANINGNHVVVPVVVDYTTKNIDLDIDQLTTIILTL